MDSVFIVTKGEYSDYDIVAVFKTQEEAITYIGPYTDRFGVEEWAFGGKRITPPGMIAYCVVMNRSGFVAWIDAAETWEKSAQEGRMYIREGELHTHMFARDSEHATKIANEQRAMIIASDCWVDGFQSPHG